MTDLGTIGGAYSLALAMNDAGQITGFSQAPDQSEHAFLYSHGSMTDLGTLGGNYSYGLAVNNAGHVTGYALSRNSRLMPSCTVAV